MDNNVYNSMLDNDLVIISDKIYNLNNSFKELELKLNNLILFDDKIVGDEEFSSTINNNKEIYDELNRIVIPLVKNK